MEMHDIFYDAANTNADAVVYLPDNGNADEAFIDTYLDHQEEFEQEGIATLFPCTKTACTGRMISHYLSTTQVPTIFVVYYDKLIGDRPRVRDDQFDPYDCDGIAKAVVIKGDGTLINLM